jgi:hypothetical protein
MTCALCGRDVPDGSQFCNHCGASTGKQANENRATGRPETSPDRPERPVHGALRILIALLLVLTALGAYQLLRSPSKVRAPTHNAASHESRTEPAQTTEPQSFISSALTPTEFTIGPAELRSFKIAIAESVKSASLVGKFTATGGMYNDIEVFVITPKPSGRSEDGMSARSLYWSRRVSSSELDVPLSSGDYYLVFSNAWSPSMKAISAQISLRSQH